MDKKIKNKKSKITPEAISFPPVVAVLGHVDHGKTSLLDAIRKTNMAQKEHGGITQSIGASRITIDNEGQKQTITFIDTPGHEAFSLMRSRGAQVADIGLLIVSLVDGVMPQTKESIALLQNATIPYIVVLTKADLPEKNPEKVKQQLLKENILLEGLGGDVPYIEVSSRTNVNIRELLELILLVFDMQKTSHPEQFSEIGSDKPLKAIVIESKLDQKSGPRATIVIKNGTVAVRDELLSETNVAKVRALITDTGEFIQSATVGDAVEVMGFTVVPSVGTLVIRKEKTVVVATPQTEVISQTPYDPDANAGKLPLILSADTVGSLEAIIHSLPEEKIDYIEKKTGEITPADILLAKSINAIVLGFNTKIRPDVVHLASVEKVLLKNYRIIYELIEEVKDVLAGKELALEEKIYGKAKILAKFPFNKTFVAGVVVLEGRIAKGDKVRIERKGEKIQESNIISLRQGKTQTSKMEKGQEAGIILSPYLDFTIGDMLISHE